MLLKSLAFIYLFICSQALATVNTLDLVGEYPNGSKKMCVYSNGHRTETIEHSAASACPSVKTFH